MFSICLILRAVVGLGVYSASNKNEYQKQENIFSRGKERPVRRADNFAAICKPTF
jgi:hypothetical protein